ncbi:MAG: tRNA glutamyl-Q(34) synthetase GluQRS [Polyangiaceae bacterium]|nr:tRNA glutamyl-Q(34) synthetase GluQRS [Polyangiaceae bacterium]
MVSYRGRFAPSPTGALHLGSVATALFAAAAARRAGGGLVLRVEDLDPPRLVAGSEASQLDDLGWLGLTFDEGPREGGAFGPYRQSERFGRYEAALETLDSAGLTYLCDCSRAEIARVASAPHEGEDGPRYPGTCRDLPAEGRVFKRPPAVRLRVPEGDLTYEDTLHGTVGADVAATAGDFVLRRGDGVFSYQLAVTVDDVEMGITEVVRGSDLRSSAARQALIARLLGKSAPRYLHVPLLVGADGQRLAKRNGSTTIAEHRSRGLAPEALLATIAAAYGHDVRGSTDPVSDLAASFDPRRFPSGDVRGIA